MLMDGSIWQATLIKGYVMGAADVAAIWNNGNVVSFSEWDASPSAANVTFTGDESIVTVSIPGQNTRIMYRPITPTWNFSPSGTTYYVATDGDNTAAGTSGAPFKTIQKALDVAVADDLIYVRAGTYIEPDPLQGYLNFGTNAGTSGHPIILSCAPGDFGKVRINLSSEFVAGSPGFSLSILISENYITLNGLIVEGSLGRAEAPLTNTFYVNCVTVDSSIGVKVMNCALFRAVHCGLKAMAHGELAVVAEGCITFENGSQSTDHGIYLGVDDCIVHGNISFRNGGYGAHMYNGPGNATVTRNVAFANATSGSGGGILNAAHDSLFEYNTVDEQIFGILYFRSGCTNNNVDHNIMLSQTGRCCAIDDAGNGSIPTGNHDDYNDYFPDGANAALDLPPGAHEVNVDPLFVNPSIGDYRLQGGSTVTDKGAYA
jgi:hypothetical protein